MATILHIFICPEKGQPMQSVSEVRALLGLGLHGDRYASAAGSWNQGKIGKRQVSFIDSAAFEGTGFTPDESRRNIVTEGIDLTSLIGKDFSIVGVRFHGVKYCDPCARPSNLCGRPGFKQAFYGEYGEKGGILADVMLGGVISVGDSIVLLT